MVMWERFLDIAGTFTSAKNYSSEDFTEIFPGLSVSPFGLILTALTCFHVLFQLGRHGRPIQIHDYFK